MDIKKKKPFYGLVYYFGKNTIEVTKHMLIQEASVPPDTVVQVNESTKEDKASGQKGDKVKDGTQEHKKMDQIDAVHYKTTDIRDVKREKHLKV